jgi:hypothetical protein
MEDFIREKELLVLKYVTLIENYFTLRNEVNYYDNKKDLLKADKYSHMTELDEEYFIKLKKMFEQSDENEFWISFFVSIDPSFYEELLCAFKKDSQRRIIISGLKFAYESMNESFKRDYHLVYMFLLNYWVGIESDVNEVRRIKWGKERKDFAIFVYEEFNKSKKEDLAKFVRSIYSKYEFPTEWQWTLKKCLSFVYDIKKRY